MRVKNSNFVDYVKIFCRSGRGGAGSSHFLRDKTTAKGGPDGGDGGRLVFYFPNPGSMRDQHCGRADGPRF